MSSEQVTLTEEVITDIYGSNEQIQKLITLPVLLMFAGETFTRGESGWKGEGGFYGSSTALGMLLEAIISLETHPNICSVESNGRVYVLCKKGGNIYFFISQGAQLPENAEYAILPDEYAVDTNRGFPRLVLK